MAAALDGLPGCRVVKTLLSSSRKRPTGAAPALRVCRIPENAGFRADEMKEGKGGLGVVTSPTELVRARNGDLLRKCSGV